MSLRAPHRVTTGWQDNPPQTFFAPKLFRNLKVLINDDRHSIGQAILTGSQRFMLMKEVSDGLACWASVLSFENLSFKELGLEPAAASLTEWLAKGFHPKLWRQADLDRATFYATSVASYSERDFRQILTVQSLQDFERFLRARAVRSGHMLHMAKLDRDRGIKAQTAKDWLGVLETSVENIGKRLVKAPHSI